MTLGSMMIFPPFPSVSERAMIAIGEVFSMISLEIVIFHPRDTIVRFSGDVDVKSVSDIEISPSVTLYGTSEYAVRLRDFSAIFFWRVFQISAIFFSWIQESPGRLCCPRIFIRIDPGLDIQRLPFPLG